MFTKESAKNYKFKVNIKNRNWGNELRWPCVSWRWPGVVITEHAHIKNVRFFPMNKQLSALYKLNVTGSLFYDIKSPHP